MREYTVNFKTGWELVSILFFWALGILTIMLLLDDMSLWTAWASFLGIWIGSIRIKTEDL